MHQGPNPFVQQEHSGLVTNEVLTHRMQLNEQQKVQEVGLWKTRILDGMLLLTFSMTLRKLHPLWPWSTGHLSGLCKQL